MRGYELNRIRKAKRMEWPSILRQAVLYHVHPRHLRNG